MNKIKKLDLRIKYEEVKMLARLVNVFLKKGYVLEKLTLEYCTTLSGLADFVCDNGKVSCIVVKPLNEIMELY